MRKLDQPRGRKVSSVRKALLAVKNREGVVTPEAVVDAAKSKTSPLHGYFTWDMKQAAHKCWLDEARLLIRTIIIENREDLVAGPPREFLSLVSDRTKDGGYRHTPDVLTSADLTQELIDSFLKEEAALIRRYQSYPVPELERLCKLISKALGITGDGEVARRAS